jgi:oligoendopeptidase F
MTDTHTLPARAEVPFEQTWALESVFATPDDWNAACKELEAMLPSLAAYKGRLVEGPQALLECLAIYEKAGTLMGKIFNYASNSAAVDTSNQEAAARDGQARGLAARSGAAAAFFNPELMEIGFERLRQWMAETPALTFLAHYVDDLEKHAQHLRSGEVEQVLAQARDPFSSPFAVYTMLNNADLKFEPATASDGSKLEVGQSSISSLRVHPDREVRRTGWRNYADGYLAFRNTYAASLIGFLKQQVFDMRVRNYPSTLNAAVTTNNIPEEVFHNLIAVFQKNLPTWHRYWRLRKRLLGYDSFHEYDIKAPLAGKSPVIPFEQAVEWITAGMAPLGEEYAGILRRGCTEERWVDRALNRGKREGAYSSGSYGTRPFIMMSYADDIYSLSTLAHELGHSMHSYYTRLNQPYVYSRYGIFVAEVASNFNQAMMRDYLFKTQTSRDFQIALIEEAMSNYHRYFFIMPTLARFELEMYTRAEKGAPLSAQVMIERMAALFKEGYGDELEMDTERTGITWAQFQHMYMNYYVYQYATGISGAHALVHRIQHGEPGAVEAYLDFLKAGASNYPLEILQRAGVDLTSPEPVQQAFGVLSGLVDRLEQLV